MKRARTLLIALASVLASGLASAQFMEPQTNLPRTQLRAGVHVAHVQVAQTMEQLTTGLMWRQEMPEHEGMLFVFPEARQQCFWMKNTVIPLTAAFIDDDGTIVNLWAMKPLSLDSHCSTKPVRFVLEMNKGWFTRKHLKEGDRIQGEMFKKSR